MLDMCENSSSISSGMGSEEGPEKSSQSNGHGSNGQARSSNGHNNGHRPNPFQKRPFLIGVAGGTSSGKSTVCSKIMEKLGIVDSTSPYLTHEKRVICISQDSFYRKLTEAEQASAVLGNFNFDHPSAFDAKRLTRTIRDILKGKMVKVPIYNYAENQIENDEEVIYPADVVLVEGLLLFYFPEVRDLFHMKIFVDTDMDTRLSRRVIRDVNHRNRDLNWVLDQYMKFVKPSFEEFCLPTKKYADIIVPRGPDNEVAIGLIVQTIRDILEQSTMAKVSHQMEVRSSRRPSKITHEHRHHTNDQPFCSQPTTPISDPDFQERMGEFSSGNGTSGIGDDQNDSSGSDFEELFQRQRGFSFSGNSYSYS